MRGVYLWQFQSTLPRRERPVNEQLGEMVTDFNPRSREGSDKNRAALLHEREISIHAPAKGATITGCVLQPIMIFQSTLPRRERLITAEIDGDYRKFQSTLPRRERRSRTGTFKHGKRFQSTLPRRERQHPFQNARFLFDFNPRSREGSDERPENKKTTYEISIHAPAKGATKPNEYLGGRERNFNPRSREGSDSIY